MIYSVSCLLDPAIVRTGGINLLRNFVDYVTGSLFMYHAAEYDPLLVDKQPTDGRFSTTASDRWCAQPLVTGVRGTYHAVMFRRPQAVISVIESLSSPASCFDSNVGTWRSAETRQRGEI